MFLNFAFILAFQNFDVNANAKVDKFLNKSHNKLMKIKRFISKFWNGFEDLFMTSHSCVGCGREVHDGTEFSLCEKCREKFEIIKGTTCLKCGEGLLEGNKLCGHCKEKDYHFDKNFSLSYYTDVSAKVVKDLKYGKKKFLAKKIAESLAGNKDYFEDVDVLTFVPVSKKRKKERGFNQAEEIALHLGMIFNKPVKEFLIKKETGVHQAGLTQKDRLKNLIGSFELNASVEDEIKGKVVLIVDDVFTTGSTLDECSKMIRQKKPKMIKTVTYAKTKFDY